MTTSDTMIRFDRVSKRYRLSSAWSLLSIRDEAARLGRRLLGRPSPAAEEFWALRDVSFDIRRGETVGLVGSNGSGKSTTLKILSRVTVPTTGTFAVSGTVGALIEVGAGFHPDLSGRENVYLNGAIMGMRRAEIEEKFERIVAFAEVEKFIDTAIKYYSSGMQVRLGFAVAAHIDPEILLVDEVLAVGDAAFQAKCLNKIAELRERDRTIVLVSHNMANIVQHCDRVLWIDRGELRASGDPETIVEQYLRTVQHAPGGTPGAAEEVAPIRISSVTLRDAANRPVEAIQHGGRATLEIAYDVVEPMEKPVIQVTVHDVRGVMLGGLTTRLAGATVEMSRARGVARLSFAPVLFTRGAYTVSVAVLDDRLQRHLAFRPGAATFTVEGPSVATREVSGHVVYPHEWDIQGVD